MCIYIYIHTICINTYTYTSRRIFHRPTIMIKSVFHYCTVSIFGGKIAFFSKKYLSLTLTGFCVLNRLFLRSERRQGLSSFGQDVFVMTFPTPLLTSHLHPQDFVGLTTNSCAVNGIWYSILQQSPTPPLRDVRHLQRSMTYVRKCK